MIKDKRRPKKNRDGQNRWNERWRWQLDSFWPTGHCGKGSECGSFLLARSPPPRALSAQSRLVSPGYDDHRSFSYSHNFNWKTHVISVFRLSGLSLGRPELARFNRGCVIFHKPHLQSKLMPVINQTLSLVARRYIIYASMMPRRKFDAREYRSSLVPIRVHTKWLKCHFAAW